MKSSSIRSTGLSVFFKRLCRLHRGNATHSRARTTFFLRGYAAGATNFPALQLEWLVFGASGVCRSVSLPARPEHADDIGVLASHVPGSHSPANYQARPVLATSPPTFAGLLYITARHVT